MKYWLKTFNHLLHTREIFDSLEEISLKLKEIIEKSEHHKRNSDLFQSKIKLEKEVISKDEYVKQCNDAKKWPGFTQAQLYGIEKEDRCDVLGSIIIVSFPKESNFERKLFPGKQEII